jgi:dihydrofolate synthase/folylpolyglutamate synthase
LERSERALARLDDPHTQYASLHVGGTNGKGSVTATLASIMSAAGRRSGCYRSPHLISFAERILVDGRPLSEGALKLYAAEIRDVVTACELTFFEAATLLAFHAFAREGVEVAALEVGLGGRLDATNVVTPEVSAVTNVAMDHADYLGDTLLEIAREKAGIIKPGVPFVTTERDPEVLSLFGRVAGGKQAPMTVLRPEVLRDVAVREDGTTFRMTTSSWGELEVVTPLVGRHQAANAALAVAMCDRLGEELEPGRAALLEGVAGTRHRGRDQLVTLDGRTWLLDVAHNPAGVASLADTLDLLQLPEPLVALVGILRDKDWHGMMPPLLERCQHVFLTQPPTAPPERRWQLAEVGQQITRAASESTPTGGRRAIVTAEDDFGVALEAAARLAGKGTVVVTGSVHTVGGVMRRLGVSAVD